MEVNPYFKGCTFLRRIFTGNALLLQGPSILGCHFFLVATADGRNTNFCICGYGFVWIYFMNKWMEDFFHSSHIQRKKGRLGYAKLSKSF